MMVSKEKAHADPNDWCSCEWAHLACFLESILASRDEVCGYRIIVHIVHETDFQVTLASSLEWEQIYEDVGMMLIDLVLAFHLSDR